MTGGMGATSSITKDQLIMRIIHDEISRPLDGSDIDTPRGESAKSELIRLHHLLSSRTMGEDQEEELKRSFDEIDVDGGGELDADELSQLIHNLGLIRSKKEIEDMIASVDQDGSGTIDFPEFCSLLGVSVKGPEAMKDIEIGFDKPYGTVMFSQKENRFFYKEGDIDDLIEAAAARAAENSLSDEMRNNFQKVFNEFDADNGGTIDTDELTDIMNSLNMPRTRQEIEEMVSLVDEDNSGEIDFDEFCVMMATKLIEEAGGDISALMSGSKKKQYEEMEQRKKDSGAKILWS